MSGRARAFCLERTNSMALAIERWRKIWYYVRRIAEALERIATALEEK
jgi:hypothetical protein